MKIISKKVYLLSMVIFLVTAYCFASPVTTENSNQIQYAKTITSTLILPTTLPVINSINPEIQLYQSELFDNAITSQWVAGNHLVNAGVALLISSGLSIGSSVIVAIVGNSPGYLIGAAIAQTIIIITGVNLISAGDILKSEAINSTQE